MTEAITIAVSDEITALTTGAAKITVPMETDFVITNARAFLSTPQATGAEFTVDVKAAGVSIFSTKLTIDNGQPSSVNAAAPAVIANPSVTDYSAVSIDIDQVGDGTAMGLKVTLYGYRPLANSAPPAAPPPPPPAPTTVMMGASVGTEIGDMTVFGLAYAFDGLTNVPGAQCAAISGGPGWVGKTYAAPIIFGGATVFGSNASGFLGGGAGIETTITIYGKNGTPSGPTDGTEIGSLVFDNTNNESAGRQVASTDTTHSYSSIWAYINGGAQSTYCAELEISEIT